MDQQVEGKFVDVVSGRVFPARMKFADGRVVSIEEISSAPDQYILPGLVDAHIHIESSQLCPSRFAEMAVAHGTTSVVCDPHEIANVMGMKGIEYMVQDAEGVPLRIHFTAPSCVPATQYETNGAVIGKEETEALLKRKEFVALGEVMDIPGVIKGDPNVLEKIKAAKFYWKPIDGHCPGLTGNDLAKYVNTGISTDHECTTANEAEEKYNLGMWIMAREGSGHKDLRPLLSFVKQHECFLVSDDLQAADLSEGHMDALLRKAVLMGVDPVHAIRAATTWPSWHYFLPTGALQNGKVADFIIVEDLRDFKVKEVYIDGVKVAQDGKALFQADPLKLDNALLAQDRSPEEFIVKTQGPWADARVVQVHPNQ
ncbi:MAG TPA: amidohydrolase family protein, partial [Methanomassiliicoccales archaeon]|nr:amidohydrolase family protein [Methanomassiliicoccales archaeon]